MAELVFKTLRQEVADAIRLKILDGELRPGARIVEQDIAAELGVSRGPVREALRQIEQDGLIEYTRNVGCSVKRITDEDIYEIYLLRATYEILAIKLCAGQIPEKSFLDMQQALAHMKDMGESEFDRSISYDNLFHGCVIRQLGLPRLNQLWTSLNPGNVVSFYVGNTDRAASIRRQYPIHQAVYEAYLSRDTKVMSKALITHYMLTSKRRLAEKGTSIKDFNFSVDFEL